MVNDTFLLSLGQGESPEPITSTHLLITLDYPNATTLDQYLLTHLGPKRWELYKVIPVTIVYCVIFVTGIIGNVSTCIVIARNKYMQTATNYYLFNLAIADLLVLVSGLPLETYSFWQAYPWIFGEAFCVIRTMASETSTYASILTITAFTVERYVAICHPMRAQTMSSLKRAIKVIILLWIVSAICSIPMVLQFGVVHLKNPDGTSIPESATCNVDGRKALDHAFEIATFLFFLTPMTVITVLYALIGLAIKRSALSRAGSDTSTQNGHPGRDLRARQQAHARRSVLKMLVAVVVAFFICWAPFHLQRLMAIYIKKDTWNDSLLLFRKILYYVSGILYYVSTTINPILYNTMSLKFRQAFKNTIFRPCKRKNRRRRLTTYKFYNKPPTDTNMTLVQGQPFLKFQRLRRGLPNIAVPFVSDPKSNSSSVSGGSSARVLETPRDGIELDPMLAEYKSHSFNSPQTLNSNHNYRPYHSFT